MPQRLRWVIGVYATRELLRSLDCDDEKRKHMNGAVLYIYMYIYIYNKIYIYVCMYVCYIVYIYKYSHLFDERSGSLEGSLVKRWCVQWKHQNHLAPRKASKPKMCAKQVFLRKDIAHHF